ncbi:MULTISPECIES: F0F1 ATP synthase subunit delta [unclassified Xanthobacter]|uniref:F0F1 ATP synthase subunit delta n=1 Tax=unclassified Xanthobacter TaxID=2623496 RepID=UPI001EDF8B51|nr:MULTISPECIES: F0F1 ATP synthase subunit delta [unclassified Xanthobacter]
MQIDWWTLGLQAINVLVLVFILARFLFRPVVALMAERQAAATRDLEAARAARAAAEAERTKAAAETAAIAAARTEKVDAALAEGEARKAALLAAARSEADGLRAAAEADIAHVRARAEAAVDDRASRLAVDIAARLLAQLPDDTRVAAFIDGLCAGLAALPEEARASLAVAEEPLQLKAARALSTEEEAICRQKIAAALGHDVTLALSVDPNLIAGLELTAPHAIVRNSWRAALDRILTELTHDGR